MNKYKNSLKNLGVNFESNYWQIMEYDLDLNFSRISSEFILVIKEILCDFLFSGNDLSSKKLKVSRLFESAVFFCKHIKNCGASDLSYLECDEGFRNVIKSIQENKLSYKTCRNYNIFLKKLIDKKIIKRNIESYEKLSYQMANGSKKVRQTLAIPENVSRIYFKEAIKIIDKYKDYAELINNTYLNFVKDYKSYRNKGLSVVTSRIKAQRKNMNDVLPAEFKLDLTGEWLSLIRGACYIIIAGFTGCRDAEVKSFNLSSYEEKDYAGIIVPILKGIHTKPNIGGVERITSWVTVPIVKDAIYLLWTIYDFARELWAEKISNELNLELKNKKLLEINSLFISYSPTSKNAKAGRQAIDKSLKSFVNYVNYELTINDVEEFNLLNPSRKGEVKIGSLLYLHPHAFRRTFAVFLIRNKLTSLLDVKYQFKHMNIAMTSWYSNQANLAGYFDMMLDRDLVNDIAEENHKFMTDTFYYLYNEAETLSGIEGKRILELRKKQNSLIYISRDEISQQIKNGQLSIIDSPVGHCTNPQCNRVCDNAVCKYKIVTKEQAFNLAKIRGTLISKFNRLVEIKIKQPSVLSKIFTEIKAIEKVLDDHYISYDSFNKKIDSSLL